VAVTVALAWAEYVGAVHVGLVRFGVSQSKSLNHASTMQRNWTERLMDEIGGACGERAWCKWMGRLTRSIGKPTKGNGWRCATPTGTTVA
jgi:hypothetical protein